MKAGQIRGLILWFVGIYAFVENRKKNQPENYIKPL